MQLLSIHVTSKEVLQDLPRKGNIIQGHSSCTTRWNMIIMCPCSQKSQKLNENCMKSLQKMHVKKKKEYS